ncbi:MAG TPA: HAMP domain-containing sensor histidine kinase [Gaiellales bacterium]|jgi:signal transduction histidine kinase
MRRGLAIRTRLAIVSATLAVGVLAAGLLTVYLIDRRQVDQSLAASARRAAADLADSTLHLPSPPAPTSDGSDDAVKEPRPESRDELVRAYLRARSGSDQLLASLTPGGGRHTNRHLARRLWARSDVAAGDVKRVEIRGDEYVVAAAARDGSRFIAAVPAADADAGVRTLLDAMLIVCLVGLIPATGAAWLVTRRALAPLSRIAQRASRVTGGDLSVRMGPVPSRDEIADVADAIDAMLDRLEGAFAAQRRFVHDASHELRTPLTIARGHLETALAPGGDPAALDAAARVAIAELDRMARLVESLLRLARTGADGPQARELVDVGALAERVVERSRVLGDRAWHVAATEGAMVDGDSDALEQVLLNLVSNAVRHTAPRQAIGVRVDLVPDAVVVEVSDTGEGIDPDLLPTLFDRFTRADDARGRDTGGAGLGLAICRAIVDAHGGTITAASTPGLGATFTVELPKAAASAAAPGMRTVSPPVHA